MSAEALLTPLSAHLNCPLLAKDQRDRIEIVLVSPRNPLNIGAAARSMARLRIASPPAAIARNEPMAAKGSTRKKMKMSASTESTG